MAEFCYNCGANAGRGKYCEICGTDTNPPQDVFFSEEDCGDCNAPLPRWASHCPKCGRKFGFTEPTDQKKVAKRNRGLLMGGTFFSIAAVVAAAVLSSLDEAIPLKYALIGAAVFITIIWITTAVRWERGKFKDGVVIEHFTQDMIRTERDINNTTITGKPTKRVIHYTLFSTKVRFDDGTTETFSLECAANHIQLKIGDGVRYYLSTRSYRKLQMV